MHAWTLHARSDVLALDAPSMHPSAQNKGRYQLPYHLSSGLRTQPSTAMLNIKPSLNKEKFWELRDEQGELLEDGPDKTQKLYKLACSECPFHELAPCSDHAFERAKKHWWSLRSPECVASYVKNHGMWSTLHGKAEQPLSEEAIDDVIYSLSTDIVEEDQDYDTRIAYKETIDKIEEKKKQDQQWGSGSAKRRKGDSWGSSGNTWYQDGQDSWGQSASADQSELTSNVAKLAEVVQTMQQTQMFQGMPSSPLMLENAGTPKPPQWATQAVDTATATQWDPSMQVAVQEQTISMSYAQLLLYKETIDRAKEAAKASMASLCQNLTKLQHEVGVLNNCSVVIDDLLQKGKFR